MILWVDYKLSTLCGGIKIHMNIVFYYPQIHIAQKWAEQLAAQGLEFKAIFWEPEKTIQADYAVVWLPPENFFDQVQGLSAIFNMGAGVDALLKNPSLPVALPVVRLDDEEMGLKMTEYVLFYIAHITRNFNQYERLQQNKQWGGPAPYPFFENWPIGVMGFGRVGAHIAQTLRQLGYPVHVWSRQAKQAEGIHCYHGKDGLAAFLNATKILINVLPLTPETSDILNTNTLSQLQSGSYLINIGRGHHLDEQALIAQLDSQHMAGAILDVFRTEPLPAEHPFWTHPNIRVTPHISGPTHSGRAVQQITERIRKLESGQPLDGVVNRETGY